MMVVVDVGLVEAVVVVVVMVVVGWWGDLPLGGRRWGGGLFVLFYVFFLFCFYVHFLFRKRMLIETSVQQSLGSKVEFDVDCRRRCAILGLPPPPPPKKAPRKAQSCLIFVLSRS